MIPNAEKGMLRFAYADPPYPGQAQKHYAKHADYAGEVDHAALVSRLNTFDGWALSTSARSLADVLTLCPADVLVMAWLQSTSRPFPNNRIYRWEPVILSGGRRPEFPTPTACIANRPGDAATSDRDPQHVIGQKPLEFCFWLFAAAGLRDGDTFVDLFPGSGAVGRAWDSWLRQPRLRPYPRQNDTARWKKHSQPDQGRLLSPNDGSGT
jgi:hypothetical protein